MSGGSSPSEDPAALRLRRQQAQDLAKLDDEQNIKIKRLMSSATGLRAFRGSADLRLPRGNSSAGPGTSNYGLVRSTEPTRTIRAPGKSMRRRIPFAP